MITRIHTECNENLRARRVHAELTLGRGVLVGHNQIEMLMRRHSRLGWLTPLEFERNRIITVP